MKLLKTIILFSIINAIVMIEVVSLTSKAPATIAEPIPMTTEVSPVATTAPTTTPTTPITNTTTPAPKPTTTTTSPTTAPAATPVSTPAPVVSTPAPTPTPGCIIQIDGVKYDVTQYRNQHSGGNIFTCSTDMSAIFWGRHNQRILNQMQKYRL